MTSPDLLQAARTGRNDAVKALLKANVDIESKDGRGWTALHNAAYFGHDVVVLTLLENQASVNAKCNIGRTPLYCAVLNGHNRVVQTLLKNNASVDEADVFRSTPLHLACSNRCVHSALTLLASGADVHAKRTVDGKTAVHLAAEREAATTIVPWLVAVGADLDAPNGGGITGRQILARRGLQVYLVSDVALDRARRDISKARLDFVRHRAMQVCIGLQSLRLDALQMCEILQVACGRFAPLIPFHQWWKIATTVKHFHI